MTLVEALPLLIAFITACITVAAFFAGRSSASKDQGKQEGQIISDLGYVKSSVDDVKHKMDKQDEKFTEVNIKLAAVEQSSKQSHHRIDGLETRISSIEERCCGE